MVSEITSPFILSQFHFKQHHESSLCLPVLFLGHESPICPVNPIRVWHSCYSAAVWDGTDCGGIAFLFQSRFPWWLKPVTACHLPHFVSSHRHCAFSHHHEGEWVSYSKVWGREHTRSHTVNLTMYRYDCSTFLSIFYKACSGKQIQILIILLIHYIPNL